MIRPRSTLSVPLGDARGMAEWLRKSGQRPSSMAELWSPAQPPMPPAAPVAPIADQQPQPAAQVPRVHEAQESATEEAAESTNGPDREMEAAENDDLGSWLSGMAAPAERELFGAASTPKPADMPEAKMPQRSDYGGADPIAVWLDALGSTMSRRKFDTSLYENANQQGDRRYDNAVQSAKDDEYRRKVLEARQGGGEMSPTQLAAAQRIQFQQEDRDPASDKAKRAREAFAAAGGDAAIVAEMSYAEMMEHPAIRAVIQRETEEIRTASGAKESDRRAERDDKIARTKELRSLAMRLDQEGRDEDRKLAAELRSRADKMDAEDREVGRGANESLRKDVIAFQGDNENEMGVVRIISNMENVLSKYPNGADLPGLGLADSRTPDDALSGDAGAIRAQQNLLNEIFGRMQSGGAIGDKELEAFSILTGRKPSTEATARRAMRTLMDAYTARLRASSAGRRDAAREALYYGGVDASVLGEDMPGGVTRAPKAQREPKPSGETGPQFKTYRVTTPSGKQSEYPLTDAQAAGMRAKGFGVEAME